MAWRRQVNRRALFLDRDGVLVRDHGYVHRVEDLCLLPGVVAGLRRFQQAGYLLVVVTNQSGIARGLFSENDYARFTAALQQELAASDVKLDAVFHCPHLPTATVPSYALDCDCRKPRPGMLLRAIREFAVDPSLSLMVGDRESDLQAGRAAGVGHTFLISADERSAVSPVDIAFPNLDALSVHFLSADT